MICEHTERKIKMPQGIYLKNIQTFNRNFESLLETQRNGLKGAANPATVFALSRAWALGTKGSFFLKTQNQNKNGTSERTLDPSSWVSSTSQLSGAHFPHVSLYSI